MFSKADTHMHTTYSDGIMTPEEMVEYIASETDLSVIAITDHDTAEGAFIGQAYARSHALHLDVVIGQEVTTKEGDVVGLFLKSTLPRYNTALEAIEAIHAQGGLAVSVHPFSRISTLNNMKGLGSKIFSLPLDAAEVRNGFPSNIFSNPICTLLNRHRGQRLAELGGSDSHAPFTVGQAYTRFYGKSAQDLRRAIENRTVEACGTLWTPRNMLRLTSAVIKRGWSPHTQVFTD
ncbi:MAG: PHP domain-containing protein [Anaerolineae bacterium]|nr:PHP domain-containing protein [Anaerolineae bacterium]